MQLGPYVDTVRHQLAAAVDMGDDDARELAERLMASLESAIRLAMLEALSDATDEITADMAPGSVAVRMRGREPEFNVELPQAASADREPAAPVDFDANDATWRITLRIPEQLKPLVEASAKQAGVSLNSWFVRTAAAAAEHSKSSARGASSSRRHITGWVR